MKTRENFTRVVAMLLILALAGSIGACKKKSKVPSKEAFLKEHQNDADPHAMLDLEYGKSDLIKAWGEPDFGAGYGASAAWTCGDKFILAAYNPDDPEKIDQLFVSCTQELVYLFSNTSVIYVSVPDDSIEPYSRCLMLVDEWFDPETLAALTPGTILQIEFDGWFMESFPEQISRPYSIKVVGQAPEADLAAIEEQTDYIRDNFTGEQ